MKQNRKTSHDRKTLHAEDLRRPKTLTRPKALPTLVFRLLLASCLTIVAQLPAGAQVSDGDIWKEFDLNEVDFQKERDYCLRLFCYFRFTEEGNDYLAGRKLQEYRVYEGISQMDVRYSKDDEDGIRIVASRNLVHPDGNPLPEDIEYWQLRPYTFLEKARRLPKKYTLEAQGDTTHVRTKHGLAGIAVRDTARQELRMDYNALAPDTAISLNLLLAKIHLSHVDAHAVYRLEDTDVDYVPQGNLKYISFEGDMDGTLYPFVPVSSDESGKTGAIRSVYHVRTEFYVDSVAYLSHSDYKASQRLTSKEWREQCGYTAADIDRLKQKLGVEPLSTKVLQRIEDQRDWDDEFAQWRKVNKTMKAAEKAGKKIRQQVEELEQTPAAKKVVEKIQQSH